MRKRRKRQRPRSCGKEKPHGEREGERTLRHISRSCLFYMCFVCVVVFFLLFFVYVSIRFMLPLSSLIEVPNVNGEVRVQCNDFFLLFSFPLCASSSFHLKRKKIWNIIDHFCGNDEWWSMKFVKEDSLWRWSKQARTWTQALSNHVPYFVDTILQ